MTVPIFSLGKEGDPLSRLVWRVKFSRFKDDDPLLPFRAGKVFSLPFVNWVATFISLTGKDPYKVRFMPTEVLQVSDDAVVGDMKWINRAVRSPEEKEDSLAKWQSTLAKWSDFLKEPDMFKMPEVLMSRPAKVAPYKLVINRDAPSYDEGYLTVARK